MNDKKLSPREAEIWHAFKAMGESVLSRIGADLARAAGLSGPDFAILSRLQDLGQGILPQQELANSMGWHKSRLSHQLTRMEQRKLLKRQQGTGRSVDVALLEPGRNALLAARPVHAASVRRHLLRHLSKKQSAALQDLFAKIQENASTSPLSDYG